MYRNKEAQWGMAVHRAEVLLNAVATRAFEQPVLQAAPLGCGSDGRDHTRYTFLLVVPPH